MAQILKYIVIGGIGALMGKGAGDGIEKVGQGVGDGAKTGLILAGAGVALYLMARK